MIFFSNTLFCIVSAIEQGALLLPVFYYLIITFMAMKRLLPLIPILFCVSLYAQDVKKDSTVQMLDEVVVTGFQPNNTRSTSLNIEPYSLSRIAEYAPFNLSDALAKLPGISQMTTGNAISKPVIRGLYGNRILVLFSGIRFDNQQWQDEHGLGLSQIGIDRIEVIKGPASLLYGSDALGGVINVIEEKPKDTGNKIDFGTQLFSNTLGTLTDAGYSKRNGNSWWRLRLGAENHTDYSDGSGARVLNSRNNGYYLKAGIGFGRKRWTQENTYNFSYNQFGFIMPDLSTSFTADDRWNRTMAGPHHIVVLNLLNSQNTFQLKSSLLKFNLGLQSNSRREDEGGGSISLNMHLLSVLQNMKWEKKLGDKVVFVGNQQLTFENNTNYGGRIIIPDATFLEGNLSGYFKFLLHKFIIETGAGINNKYINTIATRSLNMPSDVIQPFTKNHITGNGMLGVVYAAGEWLTLKSNVATGFRSPNLAELSSNGLHEGVYRYELGDPNLKPEQNINGDLSAEISTKQFFFSAAAFYDRFFNYVYLSPTSKQFFGFPVFQYVQGDAHLYGGEVVMSVMPAALKFFELKESLSLTRGQLAKGGYLPFIPPYRSATSLRFSKKMLGKVSSLFFEPEYVHVFKQDMPAQFETPTSAYYLVNIASGLMVSSLNGDYNLSITVTNLTGEVYTDHLSRLKYYGLNNQGTNVILSMRKALLWQ